MKLVPLSTAALITMGQSPPSETYNKVGDGLPFFQGKTDFGDLYPTVRMYCNAPKKIAEKGDILISVRAPVGPTNINPEKSCIGRGLASIRTKKGTDTKYLLYLLRCFEPELASSGKGSTFNAISKAVLAELEIPLPPLPKQERIAAFLDKADRLRSLRRYALQLGDSYLQSVFLEMFRDPVTNPMGWERAQISDLGKVQTGNTPSRKVSEYYGDFIEWIKSDNIIDGEMYIDRSREMLSELVP